MTNLLQRSLSSISHVPVSRCAHSLLGLSSASLGGSFYLIKMLPPVWQTISLFNPVVYLVSGFRWSFYGSGDVSLAMSLGMTILFMCICLMIIYWIFRTGYRLKT